MHGVIKVVLESRGYEVVSVASGQDAIAQAALLQPSVILLDLLMPCMNGWETMAILKEQPDTKNIPIIIFSAWASEAEKSSHPEVANWLSKPPTMETLFETIHQSLKQRNQVARVLVVEDDLDLGRVLTTMFERHGIEAYHARSGREAIQMSQHVLPDLLLLDLVLPEGDGYAVVEWLRLHDCLHEVPLVVYSAEELTKADRDRLALGPTEFFTKGRITPEHFEQRVIALLNRIVTQPERD
jgi:CheY-like chemotaxis protein